MSEIRKKAFPELFQAVVDGSKTFDLRVADFECHKGDILILDEVDEDTKQPTGRFIKKKVGYVLRTKDLNFFEEEEVNQFGYQVMSLLDEDAK